MSNQFKNQVKGQDEYYTPENAVYPILKHLKPNSTIWCPFDMDNSNFVKVLKKAGHTVINTHIWKGQDFLEYELKEHYDYIISNPPYSINRPIMDKLIKLDKPFAMLIGNQALTIRSYMSKWKEYGKLQLILFENKVFFENNNIKKTHYTKAGTYFHTFYFCNGWLKKDLYLEEIEKKENNAR